MGNIGLSLAGKRQQGEVDPLRFHCAHSLRRSVGLVHYQDKLVNSMPELVCRLAAETRGNLVPSQHHGLLLIEVAQGTWKA